MKRFLCILLALAGPSWAQTAPELVLQIGHTAPVSTLTASGELLASGGQDGTVKIWDARNGALLYSLPQGAAVLAARFDGSGALVTAAADGELRFWNPADGALRRQIPGAKLGATTGALSPDASIAAFALPEGKILLRGTKDGNALLTLDGHPTKVLSLAFSPDGKLLASASEAVHEKPAGEEFARSSGDVRIWDVATGDLVRKLVGHALSVHGVSWSPDGSRLASVGESGTAVLWDAKTFTKIREFNASSGQGRATTVGWSPDGHQVLIGWRAGVQAWNADADAGKPLWAQPESEPLTSVLPLSGDRWAAAHRDGSLELLNNHGVALPPVANQMQPLTALRASADGKLLVTATANGGLYVWDAERAELLRAWQAHNARIRSIAISPDGQLLATSGDDLALRIWNPMTGRLIQTLAESAEAGGRLTRVSKVLFPDNVTAVAFSADGKRLAAGVAGEGYRVRLWDTATWKESAPLKDASGEVQELAFAPNGSLAAATARGSWGQLVVWDAAGKVTLREFLHALRGVAFTPDGNRLAAAGAFLDEEEDFAPAGDAVQIWNLRAGEKTRDWTAKASGAAAQDAAYSPDGKMLAVASRDGALRLWDATSGTPKALTGHTGPVVAVAYLTGETPRLVTAGADSSLHLWDVSGRSRVTLLTLPEPPATAVGAPLSPDWLAVTPDGYFNGSPGADRFLQWRLGPDVFPLAAFQAGYRKPEYVRAAMAGQAVEAPATFGKALPPQATIVLPKAGDLASTPLKVRVDATDDKALRNVQLFINGRPAVSQSVGGEAKPIEIGAKPIEIGAKALEPKPIEIGAKPIEIGAKPIEVGAKPIPSGHNKEWAVDLSAPLPSADADGISIKAVVTDADGLQGWDEIRLRRPGAAPTARGTVHVLAVGVSAYANPAYNLKYAASDARAFGDIWTAQQGKQFAKADVTTLVDEGADSKAVAAALKRVAQAAGPDDIVVLFLSGHGVRLNDNEFYFATRDIDLNKLAATAVPWTAFQNALSASAARRVILFLDACHSAVALGGRQAGNESLAEQMVKTAGAVVFTSSLGSQYSYELDEVKHGAFTEALIEGLGQGKADLNAGTGTDGVVNVEELLTYLRARVPQLTEGAQLPACPLLRDFGEPFPLARIK